MKTVNFLTGSLVILVSIFSSCSKDADIQMPE